MLNKRYHWNCNEQGCCVFVGGTEDYDIYMGKCHERPWDPAVLLISDEGQDYEFETQERMHKHLEEVNDVSASERAKLGMAADFIRCFFPTPERVALDALAREVRELTNEKK